MTYNLQNCDCLEYMQQIPSGSIDMILADLPYGALNRKKPAAKWDVIIPFEKLWPEYERIIKDNGAIVLFGNGFFTAELMSSNKKLWRYNLIWDKVATTGFLNAKWAPLRKHEDICVFFKKRPVYNPQMTKVPPHRRNHSKGNIASHKRPKNSCYGDFKEKPTLISDEKFPTSIISISKEHKTGRFYHPTQKPVALLEYLVRTFTNEGETVLDNTMGSGSTGVACVNAGRNFIGIELNAEYFNIAKQRIDQAQEAISGVTA